MRYDRARNFVSRWRLLLGNNARRYCPALLLLDYSLKLLMSTIDPRSSILDIDDVLINPNCFSKLELCLQVKKTSAI
jgi:hypothetical protein